MLALAIESSNPSAIGAAGAPGPGVAVGLVRPGGGPAAMAELLAVEPLRHAGRHADDQLACITRAMARAGRSPRELGLVAVSVGPGGFTALRIAVATAKMLALAAGPDCGVAAVATAHALALAHARASRSPGRGGSGRPRVAVALAGKADSVHLTVCDAAGDPPTDGGPWVIEARSGVAGPDAAAELAAGGRAVPLIADEHLPPAWRSAFAGAVPSGGGPGVIAPIYDPAAVLLLGAATAPISVRQLSPLYGREPEAVTLWRARLLAAAGRPA